MLVDEALNTQAANNNNGLSKTHAHVSDEVCNSPHAATAPAGSALHGLSAPPRRLSLRARDAEGHAANHTEPVKTPRRPSTQELQQHPSPHADAKKATGPRDEGETFSEFGSEAPEAATAAPPKPLPRPTPNTTSTTVTKTPTGAVAVTTHRRSFHGSGWASLLSSARDTVERTLLNETSQAVRIPDNSIRIVSLEMDGDRMVAEIALVHEPTFTETTVQQALDTYPFDGMRMLLQIHDEKPQQPTGLGAVLAGMAGHKDDSVNKNNNNNNSHNVVKDGHESESVSDPESLELVEEKGDEEASAATRTPTAAAVPEAEGGAPTTTAAAEAKPKDSEHTEKPKAQDNTAKSPKANTPTHKGKEASTPRTAGSPRGTSNATAAKAPRTPRTGNKTDAAKAPRTPRTAGSPRGTSNATAAKAPRTPRTPHAGNKTDAAAAPRTPRTPHAGNKTDAAAAPRTPRTQHAGNKADAAKAPRTPRTTRPSGGISPERRGSRSPRGGSPPPPGTYFSLRSPRAGNATLYSTISHTPRTYGSTTPRRPSRHNAGDRAASSERARSHTPTGRGGRNSEQLHQQALACNAILEKWRNNGLLRRNDPPIPPQRVIRLGCSLGPHTPRMSIPAAASDADSHPVEQRSASNGARSGDENGITMNYHAVAVKRIYSFHDENEENHIPPASAPDPEDTESDHYPYQYHSKPQSQSQPRRHSPLKDTPGISHGLRSPVRNNRTQTQSEDVHHGSAPSEGTSIEWEEVYITEEVRCE
ncbi:uncharacterized protein TM35_000331500 [Trypanosoma theileri]|uniref:Flagellar attachment zone protein 1 conserved domain-containing protein n=1 Tax=Trypanosoma theileri TaxID=67003 RepID=A0A1X0NMH5_9TRYP|nr:uncharacterized protein TM35_000331500 [Trypanosoma theileri]ORC85693.1 hypothetical protein TM35_000331500 [Trypanosoma theileri]